MSEETNKALLTIATFLGILTAIITIYQYLKSKEDPEDPPYLPPINPDEPIGPGTPNIINFDVDLTPPDKVFIKGINNYPVMEVSGTFTLVNIKPGAWLTREVTVGIYVKDTSGNLWRLGELGAYSLGLGAGTYTFSYPGSASIKMEAFIIKITSLHGIGDDVYRISNVSAGMLVLI